MAIVLYSALSLDNLKHLTNESAECNMITIKLFRPRSGFSSGGGAGAH